MRRLALALAAALLLLVIGAVPSGATAGGCTGGINPLFASCVSIGGNGTHVSSLAAGEITNAYTGGPWVGRFIVLKAGAYFLVSGYHTEYNCDDARSHCHDGWFWTWTNGGNGWTFSLGTEVCGGFLTQHGDWFGGDVACKTIS